MMGTDTRKNMAVQVKNQIFHEFAGIKGLKIR